ncbi:MAG: hypothetical protein A3G21_14005 [Acidobacteria bacterium RIFCSPLOWO2_12_FULL_66_21]|nr:MAG: hypothetical protein A3G21_14005 [Acidobacteria bacterium RIFCSPLOWO2_12_FULL_66_21]
MTFEERVQAMIDHGFTERQAGFLTTVMLHAGVCLGRQYCAYAGIVRGQKVHDFFRDLVANNHVSVYSRAHRKTHLYHVHAKTLYRAIGEPNNRHRRPVPLSRAIERLMVLDGVLADRRHRWLATEREKIAHFTRVTRLSRSELPHISFGVQPDETVRYFAEKLPIGIDPDGRRHVFIYLVTRRLPIDFRVFLHRYGNLLRTLPAWTVRVLVPPHLIGAVALHEAAARDELAMPLPPATVDELRWYFEQRRDAAADPAIVADLRFQRASAMFGAPRFRVLYRMWRRYGNRMLDATTSPVTADALARRTGQVDCHVLAHTYQHLSALVSTS